MSRFIIAQKGKPEENRHLPGYPGCHQGPFWALRLAVLLTQARIDTGLETFRIKLKERIEVEMDPEILAQHPTLPYLLEREKNVLGRRWDQVLHQITTVPVRFSQTGE